MTWTVRSKILSFPVDVVFDLLCDFERLGRAIPMLKKIEYLSEKRRGVGVRTRWITGVKVVDSKAGAVMEWEEEVTAYRENELLGFKVIHPHAPYAGFLQVYPYEMGTKTFVIFGEYHPYEGADIDLVHENQMKELNFLEKELNGELIDDSHKETA